MSAHQQYRILCRARDGWRQRTHWIVELDTGARWVAVHKTYDLAEARAFVAGNRGHLVSCDEAPAAPDTSVT
jgi:hypothetical protein